MKTSVALFVSMLMIFSGTACSNQWREADAGATADGVIGMLEEAAKSDTVAASAVKEIETAAASVYFAEAPGSLGTVASVVSLSYFNFLGKDNSYTFRNIGYARIFFLDNPFSDTQSDNTLILGIAEGSTNTLKYYTFTGEGTFSDDYFEAVLKSSSGKKILLRTWDVEDGDFTNVIQLRVSDFDSKGNERYIGKFSTLVGYGG